MIVYSISPFKFNECSKLADNLKKYFLLQGDKVILLRFPYKESSFNNWQYTVFAYSLFRIMNTSILITINDPACYLNHSKQLVWFINKPKNIKTGLLKNKLIYYSNKSILKLLKPIDSKKVNYLSIPKTLNSWISLIKKFKKI